MKLKTFVKHAATRFLAAGPASAAVRSVAGRGRTEATILCYHDVGESAAPGVVDRKAFEEQCAFLSEHTRVVELTEVVDRIRRGDRGDRELVAITFDDGWRGSVELAAPILNRLKLPFTMFVIKNRLEGMCHRPHYASRSELLGAIGSMGAVGAHGVTHAEPLTELAPEGWLPELRGSWEMLVDLGVPEGQRYFCYPWARYDSDLQVACRSIGFDAAFAGSWRRYHSRSGLFRIGRVTVDHDDDVVTFAAKLRGGRDLQGLVDRGGVDPE